MTKEITKDADILSTPCEVATIEDLGIANELVETIESMENVACLAANQIGETKCIGAYLDDNDEIVVIFNPKLVKALHPQKMEEECFSFDEPHKVTRYECATVSFQVEKDGELIPQKREFHGRTSQVVQHLIDHCKGKLV